MVTLTTILAINKINLNQKNKVSSNLITNLILILLIFTNPSTPLRQYLKYKETIFKEFH